MACYHPIAAYQEAPGLPVRLLPDTSRRANLALPCAKCLGCRQDKATEWARRSEHEASSWPTNSFLTLTYDDEHLPEEGQLVARDLQLFLKRLRKHAHSHRSRIDRDRRSGIRYIACGEYGAINGRPHYHALLFNCGFTDTRQVGENAYESEILHELWPYGIHGVGEATPGGAAGYIAKYTLKRLGTTRTGEVDADGVWRPAPFMRMSLKPAIGTEWLKKYHRDCTHGYIVSNGRRGRIPRTYRTKLATLDPELAEEMKWRTFQHRMDNPTDNDTPERRTAAEHIHKRLKELTEKRKI